ncbi:MAG: chemotaxis-specific protein-glutamate methyltransferase CheB [Candidatus Nanoarchaeia archaeon]
MNSVFIVDGSALTRKILRETIGHSKKFKVGGYVTDADYALFEIKKNNPDLIILDIERDSGRGLKFLKDLMEEFPKPVLVISDHTDDESKMTFEALEAGAIDFLLKPKNLNLNGRFTDFKEALVSKLEVALESKPKVIENKKKKVIHKFGKTAKRVVVFGASTGGPSTIKRLFSELPGDLPFTILVVQHMPSGFTRSFAEHLDKISDFKVKEAEVGEKLVDNTAYICPADYHMSIELDQEMGHSLIQLTLGERLHGVRPSLDYLMKSVVPVFGEKVVMVVLTGMGKDGLEGAKLVKAQKGRVLVESEDSCIIYGMPKAIVDKNLADAVVSLDKLPVSIVQEVEN